MEIHDMKATKDQLAFLVDAIRKVPNVRWIATEYQDRGLSPMRFRWDAFWASKIGTGIFYDSGMHDEHIDTTLRAAMRELGIVWAALKKDKGADEVYTRVSGALDGAV